MIKHLKKNKFYYTDLLVRILTKNNIIKILIIFIVGLISRILIGFYYDVNVFLEYYKTISLIYYGVMAIFTVVLGEILNYFDLNILPVFIINELRQYFILFTYLIMPIKYNLLQISNVINKINKNIYYLFTNGLSLKLFDIRLLKEFFNYLAQYLFINKDKITLGSNIDSNKTREYLNTDKEPFKITNALNKNKDDSLLPNTAYKPATQTQGAFNNLRPQNNYRPELSNLVPRINNLEPVHASTGISTSTLASGETIDVSFRVDANDPILQQVNREARVSNSNIPLYSPSVYSEDLRRLDQTRQTSFSYQDGNLYQDSNNSNLNTPSTMPPLFPNSPSTRNSFASNISYRSEAQERALINNSRLPTPNSMFDPPSILTERDERTSSLDVNINRNRSFNSQDSQEIGRIPITNNPYPLSANAALPNATFNQVIRVRDNIPLNGTYRAGILPIIPRNYESALDNLADTPRIDDPCSLNYQSRHRQANLHPLQNGLVTQEIIIKKPGILGKVKLGFKSIGHTFSNGVNKIESAYIHYETVGRRHLHWTIIEENKDNYESYQDFKISWDSNASVWKEIKKHIHLDIKKDVEDLLSVKQNKPYLGNNVTREVEDIIRNKRPFNRTGNTDTNDLYRSNVTDPKEGSSNTKSANKSGDNRQYSRRHKHGHHRHGHSSLDSRFHNNRFGRSQ